MMMNFQRAVRIGVAMLALSSVGACSTAGGLGGVLGSVLGGVGGQNNNQVSGYVSGVDTRNRQLYIQQQGGQQISINYDQNTQVVYQNSNYSVTSLQNGDQVTLRVQQLQNGGYYTDYVQVDQSVNNSNGTIYQSGNVQTIEGNVRGVDRQQAYFTLNAQNGAVINVRLAGQVNRNDMNRFNSLRPGDYVRFYGVYTGNNNVELRQFQ